MNCIQYLLDCLDGSATLNHEGVGMVIQALKSREELLATTTKFVYIVEGHMSYEGFDILGIYDSEEAAKANFPKRVLWTFGRYRWENAEGVHLTSYDDFEISKHEVKGIVNE